jgi:MOSC domain-containing protein YiiM
VVVNCFTGGIRPLPPDNEPTGMYKAERPEPLWLGREGLAGDQQADRRVHGGPDKAVHLYPADHYRRLAEAFPTAAPLVPGALGENLSTEGLVEAAVRIGDVFRLGDARLQVSQPRSPCWKIDRRLDTEGVAAFIAAQGLTGWYFRVLEEGQIASGDALRLEQPAGDSVSLAELWRLHMAHRPDPVVLAAAAAAPGLTAGWAKKLQERAAWLARQ